jgi:mono/diheme cytochrome c family protein/rhodanese-related sulfurtransferase
MTKDITNARLKYLKALQIVAFITLIVFTSCNPKNTEKPYLLGLGYGINSSTLIVKDLEATSVYFKDTLGFDVPDKFREGSFDGSISAPIFFANMSVLQLLSLNDTLADEEKSSFVASFLKNGDGAGLYTLSSSSVDSTALWLNTQGFTMDSIKAFRYSKEAPKGWSRDDGSPQARSLDFNSTNSPALLPSFIEQTNMDYKRAQDEWKTYYSYGRRYQEHANGAVGIAAIRVAVEDITAASRAYKKMGFTELASNDSLARFQLYQNQELHLLAPKSAEDELSNFLKKCGSGLFAIRFEVINLDSTLYFLQERLPAEALILNGSPKRLTVLKEYARGVQLEFVQESKEQGELAQMLRPDDVLDSTAIRNAAAMYAKYCALCHGDNREGYAADNAPSLRSNSLLATSKTSNFMRYTIQFGRGGTAMAGYMKSQGGPLEYIEIELLLNWLYQTSGIEEPIEISREPVLGDVDLGTTVYATNCAVCHGINGEGISAPALGNPMLLATATDHFLRYAIAEGRDGTPMQGFKDRLSNEELDGVTAFLRSRASRWDVPKASTVTIPLPEDYVLNPNNKAPQFTLREGRFVSSEQLFKALQDSVRIIILDARSEVAWRQTHIPGSIPVPYYEEPENFIEDLPNDSTWIVAYCACPHAASGKVVNTLNRHGFKNTAILDEGVLVWAQLGYPIQNGN